MKIPEPISDLFDQHDDLCRPVVFWQGKIHGLSVHAKEKPHTFGGLLPPCEGISAPQMHRLVMTMDLSSFGIQLPNRKSATRLPLIFRFDLNVLTTDYVVEGDRLRFDHPKAVFGAWKSDDSSELPYPNYPNHFPEVHLGVDVVHPLEFEVFQELCTSQGLEGSVDEPDISGHFFVIIPTYKELDVSLWAAPDDPDADLAEGGLCIFDFNPKTGHGDAFNQCT